MLQTERDIPASWPLAYETRFAKIETDLAVIKWMLGVVIAGVVSLVVKAFA
ncbi:MAG TPA: hypothetical protein VGR45_17395 [Stellaceae bacterium]|nr:hypothetical protein [Stellaceae bacterium]